MDPALFGSRLRLARERQHLTLQDLAARTKLHASLFAALEEGTCRGWPVGVYSRSHVRTYAELVGLDGGEVVEEFSALFPHLAWSDQDQSPEVVAVLRPPAIRSRSGMVVAPLRLALADEPLPFWRSLLTKIAWLLHRLANGTERTTSLSGIADAALNDAAADADAQGEGALVPFRGLQQVD
jgi:transcriptional regulator with XRE-family HTH domain